MEKRIRIRQATESDRAAFIELSLELARYNRNRHPEACKYDDFNLVLDAIKKKAEKTFNSRNKDTLILICLLDEKPAGYTLGRIITEAADADNGTGRMGLYDELFLEEWARGHNLGKRLTEEVMNWMKQQGISRVKLHAYSWNTAARKLYEKCGFQEYASSFEKFI